MAGLLRSSLSFLSRHALLSYPRYPVVLSYNTLFTNAALGLDKFTETRQNVQQQFGPMKEKFIARIQTSLENSKEGEERPVFTEDLKNVIYLIQDSDEDIDLLRKMTEKFACQNPSLRFGNFIFGPVIMRILHLLKKPELAIELLRDPKYEGMFEELRCYSVAGDLLFNCGKYDEVINIYKLTRERQLFGNTYPLDLVTLVAAASYKIGTAEAYNDLKNLTSEIRKTGAYLSSRSLSFFAAFAMKYNDPGTAFEALSVMNRMSALPRNLKVMLQCHLGRVDDALMTIGTYLNNDRVRKGEDFCQETVDLVRKCANETNEAGLKSQAEDILKKLEQFGHVTQKTIEELLFAPIPPRFVMRQQSSQPGTFGRNEYQPGNFGRNEYQPGTFGKNQYQSGQYNDRDFLRARDRKFQRLQRTNASAGFDQRRMRAGGSRAGIQDQED